MSNSNPKWVTDALGKIIKLCQAQLAVGYDKEGIIKACDLIRQGLDLIEESI